MNSIVQGVDSNLLCIEINHKTLKISVLHYFSREKACHQSTWIGPN